MWDLDWGSGRSRFRKRRGSTGWLTKINLDVRCVGFGGCKFSKTDAFAFIEYQLSIV
jgi:hypothetical protein